MDSMEINARSGIADNGHLEYIPRYKIHHIGAWAEDIYIEYGQHSNLEIKEINTVGVDGSRSLGADCKIVGAMDHSQIVGKIDEARYISLEADGSIGK